MLAARYAAGHAATEARGDTAQSEPKSRPRALLSLGSPACAPRARPAAAPAGAQRPGKRLPGRPRNCCRSAPGAPPALRRPRRGGGRGLRGTAGRAAAPQDPPARQAPDGTSRPLQRTVVAAQERLALGGGDVESELARRGASVRQESLQERVRVQRWLRPAAAATNAAGRGDSVRSKRSPSEAAAGPLRSPVRRAARRTSKSCRPRPMRCTLSCT